MGVLNSWEKLLMKSERRSSVFSSSWAMELKLSERRTNSCVRSRWTRTWKLPWASWLMASIRSRMGLRGIRLARMVRAIPTRALTRMMNGMGRQNWGMGISAWYQIFRYRYIRAPCRVMTANMMTNMIRDRTRVMVPNGLCFSLCFINVSPPCSPVRVWFLW